MNHKPIWASAICVAIYALATAALTADPQYISVRFLRVANETEPSSAEVVHSNKIPERTTIDPAMWDLDSVRRLIFLFQKTGIYHEIFRRAFTNDSLIIHIINPVESMMPGHDISVGMIKYILEKRAYEMALLPWTMSTKHPLKRFANRTLSTAAIGGNSPDPSGSDSSLDPLVPGGATAGDSVAATSDPPAAT